jgi:hypothetical protein
VFSVIKREVYIIIAREFNESEKEDEMLIMIAGPYSAPTEEQRQQNLDALNRVAAQVLHQGHIPVIGMNAALPVVEQAKPDNPYQAIMDISLALAEKCDAVLMIGESPGANMEREVFVRKGLPVYNELKEIPDASA